MKKLSELNGDEFFDVLYALTPILPALENIELADLYINGKQGKSFDNKEVMRVFVQGISEILKLITSKENRDCAWEILAIVDGVKPTETRKYLAPKIWLKLKTLFSGDGIKAFFPQQDKSESAE